MGSVLSQLSFFPVKGRKGNSFHIAEAPRLPPHLSLSPDQGLREVLESPPVDQVPGPQVSAAARSSCRPGRHASAARVCPCRWFSTPPACFRCPADGLQGLGNANKPRERDPAEEPAEAGITHTHSANTEGSGPSSPGRPLTRPTGRTPRSPATVLRSGPAPEPWFQGTVPDHAARLHPALCSGSLRADIEMATGHVLVCRLGRGQSRFQAPLGCHRSHCLWLRDEPRSLGCEQGATLSTERRSCSGRSHEAGSARPAGESVNVDS